MNQKLLQLWREIVFICTTELDVIPTLYASNAVVQATGYAHPIHDIDFLLPERTLSNQSLVIDCFSKHGFVYQSADVMTFVKDGIEVEIGAYEYWAERCHFDAQFDVTITDLFPYRRLAIINLIALYRYLQTTNRSMIKKQADLGKLIALETALAEGKQ